MEYPILGVTHVRLSFQSLTDLRRLKTRLRWCSLSRPAFLRRYRSKLRRNRIEDRWCHHYRRRKPWPYRGV
jgi:hypothetical protein